MWIFKKKKYREVVIGNQTIILKPKRKIDFLWILVYIFVFILLLFSVLPLLYLIATAFKPIDELLLYPPRFFVMKPTLNNYTNLLTSLSASVVPFSRYIFNSVFVTVINVTLVMFVSSLAAYGLVKFRMPGADAFFALIIALLAFSGDIVKIPTFTIINRLKLMDTYWALILPNIAVPYYFFLMKQFTEQLENELLEAARIDGANEWKVFCNIALPNLKSGWSTLIVFAFVANWNDGFSSMMYTSSQTMKVFPLALQTIGVNLARMGSANAAALLTIIPTVVIYVIMQARVLQALEYSGIKN